MFNIKGLLNRRSEQNRSPESLLSRSSDESSENNVDSAEGFLCPSCFVAFPTGEALQNHYESSHSENLNGAATDKYVCSACKMKLGSEIELQSHFSRHHSAEKKENDSKSSELQLKAWEEIKLYMENELKAKNLEITKLKEERVGYEQMATKQTREVADLKLNLDELTTLKKRLQNALKESDEQVKKLEIQIQQRPEQDDVIELQKGINTVQKKMDELALQKDAEKEELLKQYNILQETCSKLNIEKLQLENVVESCPKKEEMESLRLKISEMAMSITHLKEDREKNKAEKQKLQLALEKCGNYEQIKASLTEKQSSLEELSRLSKEKDFLVTKLKDELDKRKKDLEEIKVEKERLMSEIANGKGVTEAMLQLKEENSHLRQQFLKDQTLHLQEKDECESKLNEMRLSLKKTQTELRASDEKCSELESEFNQLQTTIKETEAQKDALSKDLNIQITQIADLSASREAYKLQLHNLEEELRNLKKLYDEKSLSLENLLKELKLARTTNAEVLEKLQTTKMKQDEYISGLAAELIQVQNEIGKKEQSLTNLEKAYKQLSETLEEEKIQKLKLQDECKLFQRNSEEASERLKSLEYIIAENEVTKVDFSDKISSLNEKLLESQLEESKLNATLENLNEVNFQVKEKCASLEDEIKSLKSTVTRLQNEKNSLLNELENVQKNVSELNELKTSQEKSIQELTDLNQKEKAHSEKVMGDFDLAKEVYLNDKLKMQKQIEYMEMDCAKQLSEVQETVNSLKNQLEEAEKKSATLNSTLEETKEILRQKEIEWEKMKARHIAQAGVLSENIHTLREDLSSEQKRRDNAEKELEELRGSQLELDAKLKIALEERNGLLNRCIKSEAECEKLQKSVAEMRNKYEDCVAALQELGRENQTLQVENMKHITRKWADDSEVTHCTTCGKLFTVTIRKHHCRNCGNIFCNECSAKTATVASSKKPVRVCEVCYTEVTK